MRANQSYSAATDYKCRHTDAFHSAAADPNLFYARASMHSTTMAADKKGRHTPCRSRQRNSDGQQRVESLTHMPTQITIHRKQFNSPRSSRHLILSVLRPLPLTPFHSESPVSLIHHRAASHRIAHPIRFIHADACACNTSCISVPINRVAHIDLADDNHTRATENIHHKGTEGHKHTASRKRNTKETCRNKTEETS